METKTNQLTVQYPTLSIDPDAVTLADLRQLRTDWLTAAQVSGDLANLKKIVINLGERFEAELRYPWNERPAWRLVSGEIEARMYRNSGPYLPALEDFDQVDTLRITVAGRVVCRHRFSSANTAYDDAVYVPGAWTETLLSLLPAVERSLADALAEQREEERSYMLWNLCIGVSV